jgi:hypothetical protein
MYEIVFSLVHHKVLLASAVGFLALLPLLVIDAKSFLSNTFESLGIKGNWSIGNPLHDRVDFLFPPMLNDCVLVLRSYPDLFAPVHQPVSRHADNKATGATQDCDQGVSARIREVSLFEAFLIYFL